MRTFCVQSGFMPNPGFREREQCLCSVATTRLHTKAVPLPEKKQGRESDCEHLRHLRGRGILGCLPSTLCSLALSPLLLPTAERTPAFWPHLRLAESTRLCELSRRTALAYSVRACWLSAHWKLALARVTVRVWPGRTSWHRQ